MRLPRPRLGKRWLLALGIFVLAAIGTAGLLHRANATPYSRIAFKHLDPPSLVLVTNMGNPTVCVTVWAQVLSNGTWHPPSEELYKMPFEALPPGQSFSMNLGSLVTNKLWRAVLLYQKNYTDNLAGQAQYFIHSKLIHRAAFRGNDHRGAHDQFVYSEVFNQSPRSPQGPPK